MAASRIVLAACPLLTLALALTAVRTIAPACYVAAGFIAAPIWPIGLDWVVANSPATARPPPGRSPRRSPAASPGPP